MKLEIDITCPNCNKNMKIKLSEMHSKNKKNCPSCRTEIQFTGDDGRSTQKSFDNLEKSLNNLFK